MAGIYIKDIKFPAEGQVLRVSIDPRGGALCSFGLDNAAETQAVPVPDHGRLIDADVLGFVLMDCENEDQALWRVDEAPTIIEADKKDLEFFKAKWLTPTPLQRTRQEIEKSVDEMREELLKTMTAKNYLGKIRNLDREIDMKLDVLAKMKERALSITQNYDKDGAQSSGDPHKYDAIVELEDYIDRKIDELAATKQEVMATIDRLSDERQRSVLTSYYINGNTWEQTAVALGYSYQHIRRVYKKALKSVEALLDEHSV